MQNTCCVQLWFFLFFISLNVTFFVFVGECFMLILLSFFAVAVMVPEAHAGPALCRTILNSNGCDLNHCREQCFEQFNGTGECNEKTGGLNPTFYCDCLHACGPPA